MVNLFNFRTQPNILDTLYPRPIDSLATNTYVGSAAGEAARNAARYPSSVARVLDEPYSQLTQLSGVAVQARQSK